MGAQQRHGPLSGRSSPGHRWQPRRLGRAMVLAFAAAGADVVVTSRKLDACKAVAAEAEAMGPQPSPWPATWGTGTRSTDWSLRRTTPWVGVDVLVNNAGMSPLYPDLESVTEELWDKVLGVNLKGPFRLAALVGTRMAAGHSGGSIINVSSSGAIRPGPTMLPYDAAKAGLNTLTKSLARHSGRGGAGDSMMAGPFLTDISKAWDPSVREHGMPRHALKRAGQPDEIVGAALYFATNTSSYTTGAILRVDGGIP